MNNSQSSRRKSSGRLFGLSIVHWDDTAFALAMKRACLRYTGDNKIASYTTHEKKDKDALIRDLQKQLII